jgi:hypothetical protein
LAGVPSVAGSGPPVGPLDDPRALQILTTEHWSLLASRSLTYTDAFSRAGMFLSTLSAAVVALALVAQASDFGEGFILFALVILPFVLFIGMTTYVRLGQVGIEEILSVQGMNRIRHAYFEIVPGINEYFVTNGYDDAEGTFKTLTFGIAPNAINPVRGLLHGFVTTPGMVAFIDAMLAAVIGSLVVVQLRQPNWVMVVVGALVFAIVLGTMAFQSVRGILAFLRTRITARFPSPPGEAPAS